MTSRLAVCAPQTDRGFVEVIAQLLGRSSVSEDAKSDCFPSDSDVQETDLIPEGHRECDLTHTVEPRALIKVTCRLKDLQ